MAVEAITSGGKDYHGNLTFKVFITCIIAASGGVIFGYDLRISGVLSRRLQKESSVLQVRQPDTLFTSSLYLAALLSSVVASSTTMFRGLHFGANALLNAFAKAVLMLIVGWMLLGLGAGCANQSVPIYISEMAAFKYRGALNMMFQLSITVGILVANLLNYYFSQVNGGWGWRLSLGRAFIPPAIIFFGSFLLPLLPTPCLNVTKPRSYSRRFAASPLLTRSSMIWWLRQLTGMNVFVFYVSVLFKSMGFGSNAALMSPVTTSVVNAFATLVSIVTLRGIWYKWQPWRAAKVDLNIGLGCQVCVHCRLCVVVGSPRVWLIPSEIFSLEVRSAAQSINVSMNMIFTFAIAQVFTAMLCHLKFELFIFFAFLVHKHWGKYFVVEQDFEMAKKPTATSL
ncbi:hypothetical protein SLEP1_g32838 [Rubroshorea leprosula]|uniref:Major facilitator superfamily (MFS) profile domain-containing protein n=1 Tax=Rubroshorea leprosula TaxID=152421 RepID=A0AAV5KEP2_9ROSI|nr:hypothetical protein SLEP1_g32838 [Rubroshorea leprosula]